jgi:oxygen-independent coproporphyrinogen-3 oxidase
MRLEVSPDRLEELLPRYVTAAPRYTSYPTAPTWNESFGPQQFLSELAGTGEPPRRDLSVYVHVPFCHSLCHFCACNRIIPKTPEIADRYLATLEREVEIVRSAMPARRAATQFHLGGGTPNYLDARQLDRVFRAVTEAFPLADDAEISIEVDPRTVTEEHVTGLREWGLNRLSMGIQDFDPQVQEAIHRVQSLEQVQNLVDLARGSGIESINFDLVYGLPFQTAESFAATLDHTIDLLPDRIALYSYAHVTWVAKQQRGFENKDLPSPERKLEVMLLAIRRLTEHGYVYIGLDHFARPEDELVRALQEGTMHRNFMGYTTQAGTDVVAFGPSGISELEECYAQSYRDMDGWEAPIHQGTPPTMRGWILSPEDQERRWVIQSILCQGGASAQDYEARFGRDFGTRFAPEIERLEEMESDGLVVREPGGSVRLTPEGRVLARNVAASFDAYLAAQKAQSQPLFSKTV